jgi:hypothetical protein
LKELSFDSDGYAIAIIADFPRSLYAQDGAEEQNVPKAPLLTVRHGVQAPYTPTFLSHGLKRNL